MSSSYYLGPLVGNAWLQYANSAGQVYYYDPVTRQSTFRLPNGWQDDVQVKEQVCQNCACNKLTSLPRMYGTMIIPQDGTSGMNQSA